MKKRKVRCKLKCILRKYTPKSSRLYGLVTHYKLCYVTYLHKWECFFSNFLKLKSVTANKPLQNNKWITSSCLNNHKVTKWTSSAKRHCLMNEAFDIWWFGVKSRSWTKFKQPNYIVSCSIMLRLCQLGLRPVDVGGENDCVFRAVFISYVPVKSKLHPPSPPPPPGRKAVQMSPPPGKITRLLF